MPSLAPATADLSGTNYAERFFAISRDLLCVADGEGVAVLVNAAMERVLGYDLEALRAFPLRSLVHPDDLPRVLPLLVTCRAERQAVEFEARFRRADGDYRRLSWHLSAAEPDGVVFAIGRDVTAEHEGAASVRASEARLALLVETLPVMVYEAEPAPPYAPLYLGAALSTLGFSREEWLASPDSWVNSLHPDDREQVLARSAAAIAAGEPFELEYRMVARDGSSRWVYDRGDLRRDHTGAVSAWCGVIVDITDRRATEEELRVSEERFRSLSASSPVGVFETDANGEVIYANPRVYSIYGMTPAPATTSTWTEAIHPDDRDETVRMLRDPRTMAKEYQGAFRVCLADGAVKRVRVRSAPRHDASGAVTGTVGTVEDVTERWMAEEQLRQAQKMEAVGQLAGGIAHDFNNLLTVIRTYTEFLLEQLDDASPLREDAEEIRKAAGRAVGLTGQLLAFSRKQVLQPRVVDLNGMVRGIEPLLQRLIGEDVEMALRLGEEPALIRADPSQLDQVVMNLVVNARDAMPSGGTITVSSAVTRLDARDGHGVVPGRYVTLTVRDTGCGMDDATRRRVFEPFFTTKEVGRGTGLGLSMAYGIVKQSSGFIWCHSALGKGSTFVVAFPLVEATVDADQGGARGAAAGARGVVLLAEDEDAIRALSRRILERQGFTVLEARDGRDAIRVAAGFAGTIDLLVTDMVMPHVGGSQLYAELLVARPGLRVLFVSGYTDDEIARRGISEERRAFLQKPFTPQALVAAAMGAMAG